MVFWFFARSAVVLGLVWRNRLRLGAGIGRGYRAGRLLVAEILRQVLTSATICPYLGRIRLHKRSSAHRDSHRNSLAIPANPSDPCRSEERRVGKECRSRWSPYH